MNNSIILTIACVTYNDCKNLEATIQSIMGIKNDNFEFIVIDGMSNDGTQELLKRNSGTVTKFISEKDTGIYNAMNKALNNATGRFVFFLGAGDTILISNIEELIKFLSQSKSFFIEFPVMIGGKRKHPPFSKKIKFTHHQGCALSVDAARAIHGFDENFEIHSDFLLMNKISRLCKNDYFSQPVCNFALGGESNSGKNPIPQIKELLKINKILGGNFLNLQFVLMLSRPVYYFLKGLI